MSEEANDKRKGSRREIARRSSEGAIDARQIDAFVENYPSALARSRPSHRLRARPHHLQALGGDMTVARIGARREAASRPSVADLASEVAAALRVRLKESPLLTFAAAGGVGYVLGGGVTVGVLARLLTRIIHERISARAR